MADESSPEDILSSSLQTLYSYAPITFSGKVFTHKPSGLTLVSPDTAPSNWVLHASSIWIASLFLANHIADVSLTTFCQNGRACVLELGAGSGLPGILLAKSNKLNVTVTLSDYPDEAILSALEENVRINNIPPASVRVVGHAWGQSTSTLGTFDIILAADTLWNPDLHIPFCQTLSRTLRRSDQARIYLVAGLHTGRWTIHRYLDKLTPFGLTIVSVIERRVDGTFDYQEDHIRPTEREWTVERDGEEESERRNWVVWIVVKWGVNSSP
jgi:EEF1A N-terminal glycine/lysine methyltransferase